MEARTRHELESASLPPERDPFEGIDLGHLERSLMRPRTLFSTLASVLAASMTALALIPLFSVLWMLVVRGGRRLSAEIFTSLPPTPLETGGGFGNAIVGTLVMVGLACAVCIPVGVLTGVFLAETDDGKLTRGVRFAARVLTGFPSILAGVFAYGAVVLVTGGFSAVAGSAALSILMLPTIILTAEEAVRMVPARMREAAIGMGTTSTQTALWILLPTARSGILTGVMLAVARAAGETAPLLFTALFSNYWISDSPDDRLMQPTASLAVLIYNFAAVPFDNQIELAWAAALVLVLIVLFTNLAGQALSRRREA